MLIGVVSKLEHRLQNTFLSPSRTLIRESKSKVLLLFPWDLYELLSPMGLKIMLRITQE
jgi:hypothetical protein